MAAINISSDFGAPLQKKSDIVATVSPSISHEVVGPDAMILVFWMLLSHKKEHIWVSSDEMDQLRAYYTESSESERER